MDVRLSEFLSVFFPDPDETIHIRAIRAKGAVKCKENKTVMTQTNRRELADNVNTQRYIYELNKMCGVYFIPNSGGNTDKSITRFNAVFCERDDLPISEQHALLDSAPIPTSARIETLKSVHAYWLVEEDCSESQWRELQMRLIAYFQSDPDIKNPSRLMRLPYMNHVSLNGDGGLHYKRVEIIQFAPERRYIVQELFEAFPPVPQTQSNGPSQAKSRTPNISGYANWAALKAELGRRVMSHSTAKQNGQGRWDCRGICHNGRGDSGLFYDPTTNGTRCNKGCDEAVILRAFGLPEHPNGSGTDGKAKINSQATEAKITIQKWPDPPGPAAFYGLAGDITRTIEPHTEADPVALLIQTLSIFGNVIGRSAHFVAEASCHFPNLFIVLVGRTAKGRKGSSLEQTLRLIGGLDDRWTAHSMRSGLSSGEGLIWAVRDPVEKQEPIKEKGRVTGYQTVIVDEGVADKRLLVTESEFAQTLKVAAREGNTLSAVIRQAWDTGKLRTLTKNSPACATDAHISIIGHITKDELTRYLNTTEASNGFANRFLWACVRRSKVLPEGGRLDEVDFGEIAWRLREARDFAIGVQEMKRDTEARALWYQVYEKLSEGKPGLLGAVTSRAEAQVMRLACLYALLNCSAVIGRKHLEAALALWLYCENSARFIFGDALGDPVADEILRALREVGDAGLTRTQIRDLFGRNRSTNEITRALQRLAEAGLAGYTLEESDGTNRKTERWRTLRVTENSSLDGYDINDINDVESGAESETVLNVVDVVNVVTTESQKSGSAICPGCNAAGLRFTHCGKCAEFIK